MQNNKYDVIVVGAGHAGTEAALASARMGASTLMFVIKIESIGRMSCNPTVGGSAKGHMAKEIDALGGEIGFNADKTGIQFRMLNKKKGPAVWAPRSQNDRNEYANQMRITCEQQDNLDIIEAEITDLIVENSQIKGVISRLGSQYFAPKVILACGTFLRGIIHVGDVNYSGGRSGEPASDILSKSLSQYGFNLGKFKTGTPPRVDINTVNLSDVKPQPGDKNPEGFSLYRDLKLKNLLDCYLTFTNPNTHEIINNNLKFSSLYGGKIKGTGPRYCPSIEDKIVKFSEKQRHKVFIEPEGLQSNEAYVNGISNSLPPKIQREIIHSIKGLEKSKIVRYGYAIEYDYIIPDQIDATMETKTIKGLYIAGQINGTSGYEEAAAQGITAGINAVISLDKKEPVIFDRSESYIGVLIDDLVTKGTNEPYRLFTSRAEYRLLLRQDNADTRLMPLGYKLGLVSDTRWQKFQKTQDIIKREISFLRRQKTSKHKNLREPIKFSQLIKRPEIDFDTLEEYGYKPKPDLSNSIRERIIIKLKYEGYIKRQEAEIKKRKKMYDTKIPAEFDYMDKDQIAYEAREKLQKIKPKTIGQAKRIPGINPSDINGIIVCLKKDNLI